MARNSSSDTWLGIAGIGSAIAGVIAVTTAPGPVQWWYFVPIVAGSALFFGAVVVFDRTLVRTGRVPETTFAVILLAAILAIVAVLWILAPD